MCPFPDHHEKTPSFSVSESKQVYYCFGCKKAGNIFNFLQALRGFSFPETVEYLAKKAGLPLPQPEGFSPKDSLERKSKKQLMYKMNSLAMEYFHRCLKNLTHGDPRLQYLARRTLSPEIIKTFKLGVAPDSWDSLVSELVRQKAPLSISQELGLIKSREKGGHYDLYRNRLMFPIFSHLGDCIGFGGRTLGEDQAKYINSPESEIFHKGHIFYGLHETAKFIRSADQVIVVEGYMDFMALYAAGFKNVVAVLGTALTSQHAKILKRYTRNILVLFDGDDSGKAAAERSLSILLAEDLLPRKVSLPEGMDPDDYLKTNGDREFANLLRNSQDLFLSIFHEQFKNYTGQPSEKVQILNKMAPSLLMVKDKSLQKLYIDEIADTLQQKSKWVISSLKELKSKEKFDVLSSPKPLTESSPDRVHTKDVATGVQPKVDQVRSVQINEETGTIRLQNLPKAELILINLAFMKEDFLKKIGETGISQNFSSQNSKILLEKLMSLYRQRPLDFDKFTALMAGGVEPSSAITQHLDRSWSQMDASALEKFFNDCLKKVQEDDLKLQQRNLREKMRSPDPLERQKHLEQFVNIQKHIKALNNLNEPK